MQNPTTDEQFREYLDRGGKFEDVVVEHLNALFTRADPKALHFQLAFSKTKEFTQERDGYDRQQGQRIRYCASRHPDASYMMPDFLYYVNGERLLIEAKAKGRMYHKDGVVYGYTDLYKYEDYMEVTQILNAGRLLMVFGDESTRDIHLVNACSGFEMRIPQMAERKNPHGKFMVWELNSSNFLGKW